MTDFTSCLIPFNLFSCKYQILKSLWSQGEEPLSEINSLEDSVSVFCTLPLSLFIISSVDCLLVVMVATGPGGSVAVVTIVGLIV